MLFCTLVFTNSKGFHLKILPFALTALENYWDVQFTSAHGSLIYLYKPPVKAFVAPHPGEWPRGSWIRDVAWSLTAANIFHGRQHLLVHMSADPNGQSSSYFFFVFVGMLVLSLQQVLQ